MISKMKLPFEIEEHKPRILKMLAGGVVSEVSDISIALYRTETHNNERKTKQILKHLEKMRLVRSEVSKNHRMTWMLFDTIRSGKPGHLNAALIIDLYTQHKPVLTNLEIATALFDKIDSKILYRTAAITNQMSARGELKREKSGRIVYSSLPTFQGKFSDYYIPIEERKIAIDKVAANSGTGKLMQQALLFIRIMSKINPRAIG